MIETPVSVPRETYLKTSYSPDREWIDGEVKERHLGEFDHANLQGVLVEFFRSRRKQWSIRVLPEQRVQVTSTRYRVPDLVVLDSTNDRSPIVTRPPLICIEILSPDDTVNELRERCKDYLQMGVQHVWLFDPTDQKAWTLEPGGSWIAVETELGAGLIRLPLKQIFELSAE
jgi:Uma2 family endonuclease